MDGEMHSGSMLDAQADEALVVAVQLHRAPWLVKDLWCVDE